MDDNFLKDKKKVILAIMLAITTVAIIGQLKESDWGAIVSIIGIWSLDRLWDEWSEDDD